MVKNNSQRHTEGTGTLSKVTQAEIINSLPQWFLSNETIYILYPSKLYTNNTTKLIEMQKM